MPTITEVVNPEQSQPRMHWTAQVVAVAFVMLFFGVLLPHVPDWWQRMHCPGLQQVEAPTTFISVAAMRPNNNGSYEILMVRQKNEPYRWRWTMPTDKLKRGEELEQAAARILKHETSISSTSITFVHVFGDPTFTSFEHAVTLLYLAEVDPHANIAHSNTAVSIEWIYAPWLTTHENAVGYGHQKLVQLLLHELEQAPTH